MKKLAPMKSAERVDSWSIALMVLMFIHVGIATLNTALEGSVSLLCGLAVAAGFMLGRRWLRQYRVAGHAAIAWTGLRVFETACVTLLVYLLCSMIARNMIRVDVLGYGIGGLMSVAFVAYRVATWSRQYVQC